MKKQAPLLSCRKQTTFNEGKTPTSGPLQETQRGQSCRKRHSHVVQPSWTAQEIGETGQEELCYWPVYIAIYAISYISTYIIRYATKSGVQSSIAEVHPRGHSLI